MAEKRPAQPAKKPGPIGKLANALLAFAFWVVIGGFGNIVVEWLGLRFVWPDEGVAHSAATLEAELGYLGRDFPEGVLIRHPARFAGQMAKAVHDKAYVDWKLGAAFKTAQNTLPAGGWTPGRLNQNFLAGGQDYLLAAVIATQVYAVRLAVMVSAIPVFLLAGMVAIADGLGQRDLRRFGGGRERGQVYHLARGLVFPAFTAPWVLYLSWPATVHPNRFILPFAALFGFAVWVMAGSFKKYL